MTHGVAVGLGIWGGRVGGGVGEGVRGRGGEGESGRKGEWGIVPAGRDCFGGADRVHYYIIRFVAASPRNDCASIGVLWLALLPSKQFNCMAELVRTVIARCAEVVELYRCVAPKQSAV